MKTLLVCAFLQVSILTCFSQKIIFLENKEVYDRLQKFKTKIQPDEEIRKGIWKNNGLVQKRLMMSLKKETKLVPL
jgi:hypothetical protein